MVVAERTQRGERLPYESLARIEQRELDAGGDIARIELERGIEGRACLGPAAGGEQQARVLEVQIGVTRGQPQSESDRVLGRGAILGRLGEP